MININKPFLPPKEEYLELLDDIWSRNWLTNNGPLVKELELKLKDYLNLENLCFVGNGTIALQIAIKALDIQGEIITTPFSYIATTSSIVWEGCQPIYVDIDQNTLNIDPQKIEAAITEKTTAIMATHVFGNPCQIDEIDRIAKKHNLKVIYDAAHCFGTTYKGKSVLEYGDISTISFHATKLFHTVEGGAIVTKDPELMHTVSRMRNFGHDGPEAFNGVGINGKNSELHAAMGLVNLKHVDEILMKRKSDYLRYANYFITEHFSQLKLTPDSEFNFAYFPLIFKDKNLCLSALKNLEDQQVFPRRYFYPSLNTLEYTNQEGMAISEQVAERILCLPLYFDLSEKDIDFIADTILQTVKNL